MSFLSRLFGSADASPDRLAPADFKARHDAGPVAVVDVRPPAEYAGGHLAGARLADVSAADFDAQVDALGPDPAEPVYVYCRSGNRSAQAAARLRRAASPRPPT